MRIKRNLMAAAFLATALSLTSCEDQSAENDRAQSLITHALALAGNAGETLGSTLNALSYGSNYPGTDNGNCTFLCTKGNYNQAFKRSLCLAGKTPGWGQVFYKGHYTYNSVKWDKMGTSQDHQGVCVSKHGADKPPAPAPTRRLFHDGCTGYPDGNPRKMTKGPNKGWDPPNWGQVFHGACVVHDLCYKGEPSFSGKSRSYCDDQMETYARQICYASYENKGGGFLKKNDLKKT